MKYHKCPLLDYAPNQEILTKILVSIFCNPNNNYSYKKQNFAKKNYNTIIFMCVYLNNLVY